MINVGAAMICSPLASIGLLVDVDDLEVVSPLQVLVADRPEVLDRVRRPGRHARDEQSQDVPLVASRGFAE